MSKTVLRALIVFSALLVLGSVNYSIYAKEYIKSHGEVIYLQLAPVDPRSLMQGDYVALRFSIATQFRGHPFEERIPLQLDESRVARLAENSSVASLHMRYRVRGSMRNSPYFARAHRSAVRSSEKYAFVPGPVSPSRAR